MSVNKTKIFFEVAITLLLLCFFSLSVYAGDCRACGGTGKKYIPGMSQFGVSTEKYKCHRCGQELYKGDSHMCICSVCGGTGSNGRADRKSSREEREEDIAADAVLSDPNLLSNQTYIEPYDFTSAMPENSPSSSDSDSSDSTTIIIIVILLTVAAFFYIKSKNRKKPVQQIEEPATSQPTIETEPETESAETIQVETEEPDVETISEAENPPESQKSNGIKDVYERISSGISDFQKERLADFDTEKAKETIKTTMEAAKDTAENIASQTQTYMKEHDVMGKLKNCLTFIFMLFLVLLKLIFKVILFFLRLFINLITHLVQSVNNLTKK